MMDKCPHKCVYRNCNGYCKVSVCINPYHNGSGAYKVPTEWLDRVQMAKDPDYGVGRYA